MKNKNKKVLYAEDDPDDQEFLSDAFIAINSGMEIILADNGLKAMEYLEKSKSGNDLPCLIVLDINMPYMDGKETLQKIKGNAAFDDISVVVFTSSSNPNDKAFFDGFGIEMITKPSDPLRLQVIARHMMEICN